MTWLKENAKAVVGSIIAGLGSLHQALDNNSVSAQEAISVASATLAALGVVWGVANQVSSAQAAQSMVAARQREDTARRAE